MATLFSWNCLLKFNYYELFNFQIQVITIDLD